VVLSSSTSGAAAIYSDCLGVYANAHIAGDLLVRVHGGDSRWALVLTYPYDSTSILRILAAMGARDVYAEIEAQPNGHTDATLFFQELR
jgi:hypothetical protein